MIDAIVTAALTKLADGSATALVDFVRQRFVKDSTDTGAVESLDRTVQGAGTLDDRARLREILTRMASEDPEFLQALTATGSPAASNTVVGSAVMKLIQAQNVGNVHM